MSLLPEIDHRMQPAAEQHALVAVNPRLARQVELEYCVSADPAAVLALRGKAQALAAVVHPTPVTVHDTYTDDERTYVLLERPTGEPLQEWQQRAHSLRECLRVLHDLCEGLRALHRSGVVHGSLATDCVLVGSPHAHPAVRLRAILRERSSGCPAADRRAFCRLARCILDCTSKAHRLRTRRLVAQLEQGTELGEPPSLSLLLAEIRRTQQRNAWWAYGAIPGAVVAAMGLSPYPVTAPTRSWCSNTANGIDRHWTDDSRARLETSIRATGVPYADNTERAVMAALDDFSRTWRDIHANSCQAPAAVPGLELCLYRKAERFRVVLETLKSVDQETVSKALDVVQLLGSPTDCAAEKTDNIPKDPDGSAPQSVQTRLVSALMLRELGRYDDSLQAATEALTEAQLAGSYPVAVAVAQLRIGQALSRQGDDAAAQQHYHDAISAGLGQGSDEVVAEAAVELCSDFAVQIHVDEAQRWCNHALSVARRIDAHDIEARAIGATGRIALERSDFDAAQQAYQTALMMSEQLEPAAPSLVLSMRQGLAVTLGRQGHHDQALALLQENLAQTKSRYGDQHPDVGRLLNVSATEMSAMGRTNDAVVVRKQAEAILRAALGPSHEHTLSTRVRLASDLQESGDISTARIILQEVVDAARRNSGPDSPLTITSLSELGRLEGLDQHHDQAAIYFREAAELARQRFGPTQADTLAILNNLAATLMFSERYGDAAEVYREVIDGTEARLGPSHPQLIHALLGAGNVELNLEHGAGAIALLERALSLTQLNESPSYIRATVEFRLADALWDHSSAKARALSLARSARAHYLEAASQGMSRSGKLAVEVKQWLRPRQRQARAQPRSQ